MERVRPALVHPKKIEVPLYGHATLASAAVVMERLEPGRQCVEFHTASGTLRAERAGTSYVLNFPARFSEPAAIWRKLVNALGMVSIEIVANQFNYLAVLASEDELRALAPDMKALAEIGRPGGNRNLKKWRAI